MIDDTIDRSIIALLQDDLPLESHPFHKLALQLKISETEIVERIGKLQQNGILRRWGAVVRHQHAGYQANAMVAWKVETSEADEAGQVMTGFKAISHCYLRKVPDWFGYGLFTMVHAHSEPELLQLVSQISKQVGIEDYIVIKSLKEYKKTSLKYV